MEDNLAIQELAETWRAKWYQKLWYGFRCWVKTGKWPIVVYYIPWDGPALDHKKFERIHDMVVKDFEREGWLQ